MEARAGTGEDFKVGFGACLLGVFVSFAALPRKFILEGLLIDFPGVAGVSKPLLLVYFDRSGCGSPSSDVEGIVLLSSLLRLKILLIPPFDCCLCSGADVRACLDSSSATKTSIGGGRGRRPSENVG